MEPVTRRVSWKKEIRRGPRPGDESPYSQDTGVRDRVIATMFGTQVSFGAAFAVLILVAAVFYAQYSGAVRWLFAIVLVAAGAYVLVMFVGARVRDPRPLQGSPRAERRAVTAGSTATSLSPGSWPIQSAALHRRPDATRRC